MFNNRVDSKYDIRAQKAIEDYVGEMVKPALKNILKIEIPAQPQQSKAAPLSIRASNKPPEVAQKVKEAVAQPKPVPTRAKPEARSPDPYLVHHQNMVEDFVDNFLK